MVTSVVDNKQLQDLLKPVLEQDFNATLHFGRVLMKPGCVPSLVANIGEACAGASIQ